MATNNYPRRQGARPGAVAGAAGGANIQAASPVGEVRRSQIITTYGIGAIVDLEDGSFMPMGLEDWEQQTRAGRVAASVISEARLQAQLGVDHFRLPPIEEPIQNQPGMVDARYALPVVRFPEWHECPRCHRLGTEGDPFAVTGNGNRMHCVACGDKAITNPVRFVVACVRGHISDFPWVSWAHRKRPAGACDNPALYLQSHGKSASLADLFVVCKSCKSPPTSLVDAFNSAGMKGRKCSGRRPWLHDRQDCDKEPRALQRGASNIHFPTVASALSIPPVSEPVFQMLDEYWSVIRGIPKEALVDALQGMAETFGVPAEALAAAHGRRLMIERGDTGYTEMDSRSEEYLALCEDRNDAAVGGFVPQFQNHVIDAPDEISAWFDLVGAVSRLREVRALAGFSRIEPYPVSGDRISQAITDGHVAPLSKTAKNWLPAAEIRGEGVFLRFRTEAIDAWVAANPAVSVRAGELHTQAARLADERGYTLQYSITPRLLLVHSFAHAMIRQLSIDCGYSSSALRERLYIAEPADGQVAMNGVLIYTGSPDSEGSLGGLVRQALPDLVVDAVHRSIGSAQWCGSDPVCLEAEPDQSGERISGAACHCCMLLPETACEKFNRELDRSLLVGDAHGKWRGFFDGD
jgi:hypothetical protein